MADGGKSISAFKKGNEMGACPFFCATVPGYTSSKDLSRIVPVQQIKVFS